MDSDDEQGLAFRLALIQWHGDRAQIATQLGQRFRLAQLAAAIGKPRVRELILQQGWNELALTDSQRAIAALLTEGFRVEVVTVNYDPLLERGMEGDGIEPTIICSADSYRQLTEDAPFIVKIHGCPFEDSNAAHLLMLEQELINPPEWVTRFLNGRLPERVFVYVGFSGNAEYVRGCVTSTTATLNGNMNEAYAVDIISAEDAYAPGNSLREFYTMSRVPELNYSSAGADQLFREVADLVFRRLAANRFREAVSEASRHTCDDNDWLGNLLDEMSYLQIRSFAKRVGLLSEQAHVRLSGVALTKIFKWILILVCKGILDRSSLQPVLAFPYYPGATGTASAPIIILDGLDREITICCDDARSIAKTKAFKLACQIGSEPKWYAVILNCVGNVTRENVGIIPKDPDSITRGHDPIVFVDENSMMTTINDLGRLFQA
jgi:hypothetical protein